MKDVAAALGVSTATVSRALKNDPAISVATRRAVVEMTERVQYRPSAVARRLRTKSTSLIGVVVQSVGDGYVGDVVLGIQSRRATSVTSRCSSPPKAGRTSNPRLLTSSFPSR